MKPTIILVIGLLCLAGTAAAMGSTNYDLSWNVMGGGGGTSTSATYAMSGTVGQIAGPSSSTSYNLLAGFWVEIVCPAYSIIQIPGATGMPTDPNGDCKYEDLSGNSLFGFVDVVLYFKNIEWMAVNEPAAPFDFSGNGAIGFADVVTLFKMLP